MGQNKFGAFILTHGRPDKVVTYQSLRKQGYTGPIWIVVDNEDKTIGQYRDRFGDQVIVFDKAAVAARIDAGHNFADRRAVIYARNASFDIAEQLGLDYFLQLDDDYERFLFKFSAGLEWKELLVKNLDRLFDTVLTYYQDIPALSIALAQNGDFIGGGVGTNASKIWLKRKAMNTFFCATKRPFQFMGRVNEDVNTYTWRGHVGSLFFTVMQVSLIQSRTQQTAGGMSEMYLAEGTYRKSFYTILYAPSCVSIGEIGYKHRRIHHMIDWDKAVPRIVREELRKVA